MDSMWNPQQFRSLLRKRGLNRNRFYLKLQEALGEEAPTRSVVYEWAKKGSSGPFRGAWRTAACKLLGVESLGGRTKAPTSK